MMGWVPVVEMEGHRDHGLGFLSTVDLELSVLPAVRFGNR